MSSTANLQSSPVVAAVSIEPTEVRKFESLTKRLYDDAATTMQKVAVIALFIFTGLVIIPLADAVRYGLFKAGKCDGKSYNLLDKTSEIAKNGALKAQEIYRKINPPKTFDELLRDQVKNLVKAYRGMDGNKLFSAESDERINTIHEELNRMVAEKIEANTSEDFIIQREGFKKLICDMIAEEAKKRVHVPNKTYRSGPQPSLKGEVRKEFLAAFNHNKVIAKRYLEVARKETAPAKTMPAVIKEEIQDLEVARKETAPVKTVPAAIKEEIQDLEVSRKKTEPAKTMPTAIKNGIRAQILSRADVDTIVGKELKKVFKAELDANGLDRALEAEKTFLDRSVSANLVDRRTANQIRLASKPKDLDRLAEAAARDIIEEASKNPTDEASESEKESDLKDGLAAPVVALKLTTKAMKLVNAGKIEEDKQVEFASKAYAIIEQIKTPQQKANDLKLAEEDEKERTGFVQKGLEEAKKAEAAPKAENQDELKDEFLDLLSHIQKKQERLTEIYGKRNQIEKEIQEITRTKRELERQTVKINGKERTLFDAMEQYNKKFDELAGLGTAGRQKQMDKLAEEGFDLKAIDLVEQIFAMTRLISEKVRQSEELAGQIEVKDQEIHTLINIYKVYAKNNKKSLEKNNLSAVLAQEYVVLVENHEGLNRQYAKTFGKVYFEAKFFMRGTPASQDRTTNQGHVKSFLEGERMTEEAIREEAFRKTVEEESNRQEALRKAAEEKVQREKRKETEQEKPASSGGVGHRMRSFWGGLALDGLLNRE